MIIFFLKLTDYSIGFILCDQKWILHMDTAFATGLYDFKRLNMISNDPKYASMKLFGTEHNSFLILDSWKKWKKQKKSWAFWRNQKINLLAKVFYLSVCSSFIISNNLWHYLISSWGGQVVICNTNLDDQSFNLTWHINNKNQAQSDGCKLQMVFQSTRWCCEF